MSDSDLIPETLDIMGFFLDYVLALAFLDRDSRRQTGNGGERGDAKGLAWNQTQAGAVRTRH